MHRIPYGKLSQSTDRPPVLFMHGFMMNSEVWVCLPLEDQSLPFVLAEQGYDVWLGNNRGNKYSHKHLQFNPLSERFWDMSLDELAMIDLPAMVNYVLDCTNYQSLSYIGFSQGTAQCFAALSLNPKLNTKINVFIALAATSKPAGLKNQVVATMINSSPEILYLFFGKARLLPSVLFWQNLLSRPLYTYLLDQSMKYLFGWKCVNIDQKDKLVCYSHLYSYSSVKTVVHWFQIMRTGRFQMYNEYEELFSYGHTPPSFPMAQISCPVVLFIGGEDTLVDVDYLLKNLHHPLMIKRIEHYEHLDFLWAKDTNECVYQDVISILKKKNKPK